MIVVTKRFRECGRTGTRGIWTKPVLLFPQRPEIGGEHDGDRLPRAKRDKDMPNRGQEWQLSVAHLAQPLHRQVRETARASLRRLHERPSRGERYHLSADLHVAFAVIVLARCPQRVAAKNPKKRPPLSHFLRFLRIDILRLVCLKGMW